jgi:hypothetical protein
MPVPADPTVGALPVGDPVLSGTPPEGSSEFMLPVVSVSELAVEPLAASVEFVLPGTLPVLPVTLPVLPVALLAELQGLTLDGLVLVGLVLVAP